MSNEITELRLEAKSLEINSFGKSADQLRQEIAAKREAMANESEELEESKEVAAPAQPEGVRTNPRRTLSDNARARNRAEAIRKERATRGIDMTALNYKLAYAGKEEGFEYRWVNDLHGRLQAMENIGWERVETDPRVVSKKTGQLAYLMRIPQEIYDEDAIARQRRIDEQEDEILHGINKEAGSVERNRMAGSATITRGKQVKRVSF
jgi:hypothetical protein